MELFCVLTYFYYFAIMFLVVASMTVLAKQVTEYLLSSTRRIGTGAVTPLLIRFFVRKRDYMNWNTDPQPDPIGNILRMKEAVEAEKSTNIYVNPADLTLIEGSGLFDEDFCVVPADHVPLGFICTDNPLVMIGINALMAMQVPKKESMCMLSFSTQPKEQLPPQPRNRAERRAAMKQKMKRKVNIYAR